MEISVIFFSIVQSFGISLGVGASTIAILNFFQAIADGTISDTERNFMGITYKVLRVVMIIILVSSIILAYLGYSAQGIEYFTSYKIAQLILILGLYVNALLMTLRVMPSTFGPAIQVSSWYALGFILTLVPHGLTNFSLLVFILAYLTLIILAMSIINSIMAHLKIEQEKKRILKQNKF